MTNTQIQKLYLVANDVLQLINTLLCWFNTTGLMSLLASLLVCWISTFTLSISTTLLNLLALPGSSHTFFYHCTGHFTVELTSPTLYFSIRCLHSLFLPHISMPLVFYTSWILPLTMQPFYWYNLCRYDLLYHVSQFSGLFSVGSPSPSPTLFQHIITSYFMNVTQTDPFSRKEIHNIYLALTNHRLWLAYL